MLNSKLINSPRGALPIKTKTKSQSSMVTVSYTHLYVKKVIAKARMGMGGTEYSPVLNNVITHYKDIEPSTIPAFVIFITDGENSDASRTDRIIRELSNYNMFVHCLLYTSRCV